MPRNYNINDNTGGTNMVGRAYTPQVAPWNRDDDDVSVQRSLRDDAQEWRDRRDDRDMRSLDREYDYRSRDRYGREPDAYYRRDLVPGYGDERRGFHNAGRNDHEYQSDDRTYYNQVGYRDERDDERRAGHRKHWENREPDYRYQYNDYQRADEREMRRDNQARYARQEDASGYRSRSDRDGWMSRERSDYGREGYDRDRYNDGERYYARNDEERGRWNRR